MTALIHFQTLTIILLFWQIFKKCNIHFYYLDFTIFFTKFSMNKLKSGLQFFP